MPPRIRARLLCCSLTVVVLFGCDAAGDPASDSCFTVPGDTLRAKRGGGWDANGTTLQGVPAASGRDAEEEAPPLAELDGVQLEVASSGAKVMLVDDDLVAAGYVGTASFRDIELRATTRNLRKFAVRITAVEHEDGIDRVAVLVDGRPVCEPGDEGMFVAGLWDEHATRVDADETLTYACGSGVITKCVAWGYAPWDVGAEIHQACTRMARADYCGDGDAWTKDGTMIDAYDSLGIQAPIIDPTLRFEAAWGPDGAVCVDHTRYEITGSDGQRVLPPCFSTLPACDDLEAAAAHGAVLASRTTYAPIDACE